MPHKSFIEQAKEKIMIFDGATGTNLQKQNLTIDDYHGYENCHEYLVISKPEAIEKVHADFYAVGCDIVETNTFGCNRIVLSEYNLQDRVYELNKKSVELAKKIASDYSGSKPRYVSGSMGPGSKLPSLRHTTFDQLYEAYHEQALGLIDGGVDLFQIETCQDMLQSKSALVAVIDAQKQRKKEIPIIVQVTMETTGRMLIGTDINSVITTFEPFPLYGLGMNCGTGPKAMFEHLRVLSKNSPFRISVLPNAGLPETINGEIVYTMTPEEFAFEVKRYVDELNVEMVGGCCGTLPEHLKAVVELLDHQTPVKRKPVFTPSVSSIYFSQEINVQPKPLIIGERSNSSGSKKFRNFLLKDDLESMLEIAYEQQREQAHLLDVCVAYAGRDEKKDMETYIQKLNTTLEIPIVIDSTIPEVIEAALKSIAGKSVINSINLENGEEHAIPVIQLAKRYGAALICLTIDEDGMAKTAAKKLEIAARIYDLCVNQYDMKPGDLFFDPLTFTLGSGDPELYSAGIETLNALKLIKQKLPESNTVLGLSNISFGLKPHARHVINSVFLYHAVQAGMDAAIIHAGKILPLTQLKKDEVKLCEDLIFNRRTGDYDPLTKIITTFTKDSFVSQKESQWKTLSIEEKLVQHILEGKKADMDQTLEEALKKYSPLEIINQYLLEGMKKVGVLFGDGKIQLPFVLQSAETMKKSVEILQPLLEKTSMKSKGTLLIATVKGDVHDIGKNLVDIIVSNNGYKVVNLGIKQTAEDIMRAIEEHSPDYLGLSGLLVKSTQVMKENLEVFNDHQIDIPVICGGAALNEDFIKNTLSPAYNGKVFYAKDAFSALQVMG